MDEADAHLARAHESVAAAKLAAHAGLNLDAVSRAYYAMYHAARALLISIGESPQTHKGMVQKVRACFGTSLGPELVQALARMQNLRESSDYEATFTLTQGEAHEAIRTAERFLDACKTILDTP